MVCGGVVLASCWALSISAVRILIIIFYFIPCSSRRQAFRETFACGSKVPCFYIVLLHFALGRNVEARLNNSLSFDQSLHIIDWQSPCHRVIVSSCHRVSASRRAWCCCSERTSSAFCLSARIAETVAAAPVSVVTNITPWRMAAERSAWPST